MKSPGLILAGTLVLMFSGFGVALAEPAVALRHDPFLHPRLAPAPPAPPVPGQAPALKPVTLELRATMISGDWTMANINGVMLLPGQEVEGHRLVAVGEREVVVENGGKKRTVSMDEDE